MGLGKTAALTIVKNRLKIADETIWTDVKLKLFMDDVVYDIQAREPLRARIALPFIQYSKDVDLSALTTLLKITGIEFKAGSDPKNWRNWTEPATDKLCVRLSNAPTITSGTLTGTIKFTKDSNSLAGTSTDFTSELAAGYFICVSDGTHWYRVIKVVSDTVVIIDEDFAETTVAADTSTLYRDSAGCLYLHYGEQYTLADAASDMPNKMDDVLLLGTVAYALKEYLAQFARTTGEAAIGYLETGDDLIVTAGVGGVQAPQTYAQYAQMELNAIGGPVLVAQNKWREYETALKRLGRIADTAYGTHPED